MAFGDGAICYLALACALLIRSRFSFSESFFLLNVFLFTPVFMTWAPVLYTLGLYDFHGLRNLQALIREVLLAAATNAALSVGLFYLLEPYFGRGMTPKTNLVLTGLFAHLAFIAWRHVWVRTINAALLMEKVAFVGDDPLMQEIKTELQMHPELGRVVDLTRVDSRLRQKSSRINPFHLRDTLRGRYPVDRIVVEEKLVRSGVPLFREVMDIALAFGVPLQTHLEYYETLYNKIPPHYAARPDWLLSHVLSRNKQFFLIAKRLVDLTVATVALIVLFPFFTLINLGSWLTGLKHPLYSQKRLGYLGAEFRIWKFRTMVEGADRSGPLWSMPKHDARITSWGAFLRRLRLDELPQLWNVFVGEMSLVGPRPEWVEEVDVLEKTVPHYHLRHLIKPGITGWAQVNFRATNSPEDSLEKLQYDLFYVKNMSPALDLGILLKTLKRVFISDTSFGKPKTSSSASFASKG